MASGFTITSAAATSIEDGQDHSSIHIDHTQHPQHHDTTERIADGRNERAPSPTTPPGRNSTEITATQKMLAACSGSTLTSLLVTPLDVIRVRLQAQHSGPTPIKIQSFFQNVFGRLPPDLGVTACCREVFWMNNQAEFCMVTNAAAHAAEPCAIEETSRRAFTGTWEGLVKIARYEGVSSLWRGLTPTLAMSIPANVIYFTGYDSLRTNPNSPFSSPDAGPMSPLMAGGMARMISATAISPLELFRTRLWATPSPKSNGGGEEVSAFRKTVQSMKDMVAVEGYTSLWRGLTLTLWRDVPFSAIYWLGYESTKELLQKERRQIHSLRHPIGKNEAVRDDHATTFTDSFIAGALSGMVAAFITTPFDVGKTRKQVEETKPMKPSANQIMEKGFFPSPPQNDTLPRFLHNIYKEEGIRGLWKGTVPRMLKVAPACAIMISSYEVGKKWAHSINKRASEEAAESW
ncbi:mitochondrial carrier [Ascobolus immersus RN42]|uniref:Mitochondrial carrier n=1 Tax=Ascobolus immersus RN42 TaxID=1160509 RepID=A0A3N4I4Q9_ASCIM|nr:mitochondrial carrier [Ascobolus immersus RN42]